MSFFAEMMLSYGMRLSGIGSGNTEAVVKAADVITEEAVEKAYLKSCEKSNEKTYHDESCEKFNEESGKESYKDSGEESGEESDEKEVEKAPKAINEDAVEESDEESDYESDEESDEETKESSENEWETFWKKFSNDAKKSSEEVVKKSSAVAKKSSDVAKVTFKIDEIKARKVAKQFSKRINNDEWKTFEVIVECAGFAKKFSMAAKDSPDIAMETFEISGQQQEEPEQLQPQYRLFQQQQQQPERPVVPGYENCLLPYRAAEGEGRVTVGPSTLRLDKRAVGHDRPCNINSRTYPVDEVQVPFYEVPMDLPFHFTNMDYFMLLANEYFSLLNIEPQVLRQD
jgi:hypothetical protein